MNMLTKENNYGIKSQVKAVRFTTRDTVIEAEFLREGDLKIARQRADGPWSYLIIPQEVLDGILAFANNGGDL